MSTQLAASQVGNGSVMWCQNGAEAPLDGAPSVSAGAPSGRLDVLLGIRAANRPAVCLRGHVKVVFADYLTTGSAQGDRLNLVPVMLQNHGRFIDCPAVTPGHEANEHGEKLLARIGEVILEPRGLVFPLLKHAVRDQGLEPGSQPVTRCPGVAGNLTEPPIPKQDLSRGQQRPTGTDQLKRGRY